MASRLATGMAPRRRSLLAPKGLPMALTSLRSDAKPGRLLGPLYAWVGFIVMGAFWVCFAVFLASPPWAARDWPMPTVNRGGLDLSPASSALTDLALITAPGRGHDALCADRKALRGAGSCGPFWNRVRALAHARAILSIAILERFDVTVISRYFPEFEHELPRYLSQVHPDDSS